MKLKLERPLVFFDLETTGLSTVEDRIIQFAGTRYEPDGSEEKRAALINPERPIPPESTAIHGISDADVKAAPTFAQIAPELATFFHGADLSGYNLLRFDIPMICEEFARVGLDFDHRSCAIVDVYQIFRRKEPHSLTKAMEFYCGRDFPNAHDANADIAATIDVLDAQVERYSLPPSVDELANAPLGYEDYFDPHGRLRWENGQLIFNTGRYRGQLLMAVAERDPNYLTVLIQSKVSVAVRQVCQDALAKVK